MKQCNKQTWIIFLGCNFFVKWQISTVSWTFYLVNEITIHKLCRFCKFLYDSSTVLLLIWFFKILRQGFVSWAVRNIHTLTLGPPLTTHSDSRSPPHFKLFKNNSLLTHKQSQVEYLLMWPDESQYEADWQNYPWPQSQKVKSPNLQIKWFYTPIKRMTCLKSTMVNPERCFSGTPFFLQGSRREEATHS